MAIQMVSNAQFEKLLDHFYSYNAEMKGLDQKCTLCKRSNDQMLMLSCVHDPCIDCAARAYVELNHAKVKSKGAYICQICGQETLLDSSTITELTKIAKNSIKVPPKFQEVSRRVVAKTPQKIKEAKNPNSSITSSPHSSKKMVYYCKHHRQQQITYYCFTCWTNICPECAIHGSHKDHEVKLIKKAISHVNSEYLKLNSKVGQFQNKMDKLKQGFLRTIKETNDRYSRQKTAVIRQFDILRAAIASKERDLLRELDEINRHNIAALTSQLSIIKTNYEQNNKVKRAIQVIVKKDEVLVLAEYRKIGDLQQTLQALHKNVDAVVGNLSYLNVELLQQQCKTVADGVNRFKGISKKEQVSSQMLLQHRSASERKTNIS